MNAKWKAGVFVAAVLGNGVATANCDATMPEQLREDCIVYEGAGAVFPTEDYAYRDQYKAWLQEQQSKDTAVNDSQPEGKQEQAELSSMEVK